MRMQRNWMVQLRADNASNIGDFIMAYVPRNSGSTSGNMARSNTAAGSSGQASSSASSLYSTGLFAPDSDRSKAVGTVKVKETITIPAGSYINLYENDRRKGDKDPVFKLQVRAGKVAQK